MHLLTLTDYEKSIDKNRWLKEFAALIRDGVVKGADPEQKQAFRSAMFSSVLNESVYLPDPAHAGTDEGRQSPDACGDVGGPG